MYRNLNNYYVSRPNYGYACGNPYGMNFSKQSPRVVVYSRNFAELPNNFEKKWNLISSLGRTMNNAEGEPTSWEKQYKPKINRLMTEGNTNGWHLPLQMVLFPEDFYPYNLDWQKQTHFLRRSPDPNMTRRGNMRARANLYRDFIDNAIKELDRRLSAQGSPNGETEDSAQSTPQSVPPPQAEAKKQSPVASGRWFKFPFFRRKEKPKESVQSQSTPQPAPPQVEEPIQSAPTPPTPQPVQPQAEAKKQSPVASGGWFKFPSFRRKEKTKESVQAQTPKEAKIRPVWNGNPIQYAIETLDSIENPVGSVIRKLDSIENPVGSVIRKLDSIENPLARFFKK